MISKIQKQTWESLLCVFKNFNFDITISVNLKSLASLCSLFLFLKKNSKPFVPDGRPQWEVEAKIIHEKTQGVSSIYLLLFFFTCVVTLCFFFPTVLLTL